MLIEVWSDVVCPWCFIGKRRLDKAVAGLPAGIDVTVVHRAFQLQPDIVETVPTSQHLSSKYNISPDQVTAMQANVCSIADGEGLCYDLTDTLSGNTSDAHRLLLWAGEHGKQSELLEALYSAYFEKKESIFSHDELIRIAQQVGITATDAKSLLDSDAYSEQVRAEQNQAHQYGANGVPFVVVDGKYGISGAQAHSGSHVSQNSPIAYLP